MPLVQRWIVANAWAEAVGPILGIAQWTVLRGLAPRAHRWLWANAIAWAVGMPVIFAGMDLVPWTGSFLSVASAMYLVCAFTGATVGSVHGPVLAQLLSLCPTTNAHQTGGANAKPMPLS
jgi:hypothetical protein